VEPLLLERMDAGKHQVKLELVDKDGKRRRLTVLNSTTREIDW